MLPLRSFSLRMVLGTVVLGLSLTACSHAPKKNAQQFENLKEQQVPHPSERRTLASDQTEENPVQIMKNWVVTPDEKLGFITTLDQIFEHDLFASESKDKPWSGSYWPDKLGGVAAQYRQIIAGPAMLAKVEANHRKWKRRHNRTVKNFDRLTENDIAILSPAEKYDILMGDRDFTFSNKVWEGILLQAKSKGGIANWSGICNGWTAASTELTRPRSSVRATAPDGKVVNFYPDDIKALASVLWGHDFVMFRNAAAKGNTSYSRMGDGTPAGVEYGVRCNVKKPDRTDGVVQELEECRDLNPAVWHLAIINRNGVQKKSFVMDKNYDAVVNNHTAYGYNFKYFNVKTGKATKNYREALIPIADISRDPFARLRSPKTRYVVGVDMNVKYTNYIRGGLIGETWDDESIDKQDVMSVKYDLELDADYQPVSGQWRVNRKQKPRFVLGYQKPSYPDFIWYQRQWAYSYFEQYSDPYLYDEAKGTLPDFTKPIPELLRERAKQGAGVVWFLTVKERAELLPVTPFKYAAMKASDDYDAACTRLCAIAYPRDENGNSLPATSPAYQSPEAVAARKEMEPYDTALSKARAELDKLGITNAKPYVQPVGRIVYALIEAAKKADPNPPRRPEAPVENENVEE